MPRCMLCQTESRLFFQKDERVFYLCPHCGGIFIPEKALPDDETEVDRYLEHNNDVNDPRYQQFVMPIVEAVLQDFAPARKGLDFGAGTGPVISKLLQDAGYIIHQYDPFFYPYPENLKTSYDYIACCEVIEHFHQPKKEFELLKSLLAPGGKLYLMTKIYREHIDFPGWRYKNDPTHVFLYQEKTFDYIKEKFGFASVRIEGNLIVLSVD